MAIAIHLKGNTYLDIIIDSNISNLKQWKSILSYYTLQQ